MIKACVAERCWGAAAALPSVETDVMVVSASGKKGGLVSVLLLQLEAEHAGIEGDGSVKVGDSRWTCPIRVAGAMGAVMTGLHVVDGLNLMRQGPPSKPDLRNDWFPRGRDGGDDRAPRARG